MKIMRNLLFVFLAAYQKAKKTPCFSEGSCQKYKDHSSELERKYMISILDNNTKLINI